MRAVSATLALALAVLVAGCGPTPRPPSAPAAAVVADRGIGGTGVTDDQGIGGTGAQAGLQGDDRGIGGTGIVGTITGFGSILVNGLEVQVAADQPVSWDGGGGTVEDLKVGEVVAIEADADGDRLTARAVERRHAASGPIARIDRDRGEIEVLGQTARVTGETLIGGPAAAPTLGDLAVGQPVVVSGLRDAEGRIVATRLEPRPAGAPETVRGTVTAVDARGFSVGDLRVEAPGDPALRGLAVGDEVTAVGRLDAGRLAEARVRRQPATPFAGRMRRLVVEGIVTPGAGGRGLALRRLPVEVGRATRFSGVAAGDVAPGRRVVIDGRLDAVGRFSADRVRRPLVRPRDLRRDRGQVRPSAPGVRPGGRTPPDAGTRPQRRPDATPRPSQRPNVVPTPRRPDRGTTIQRRPANKPAAVPSRKIRRDWRRRNR